MRQAGGAPAAAAIDRTGDFVLKGGWYTLWVMLALVLFGFVDRQMLTLAAAPMASSMGLSDSQLGTVQGLAFAIFSVVVLYPIAWALDRFDRRLVIGACTATWTIGTIGCGFARNFEQLFFAAVLIAAGEASLALVANSFVPELFKGRKRLLANGLIYFFSFLGIAAGLALGGGAIGALDGVHKDLPTSLQAFEAWRLSFFLVALPAPLLLLLLAFTRLGRSQALHSIEPREPKAPFGPFVRENWYAMATLFGALALYMLAFGGYLVWLPVAATRLFDTTPAQNGNAMGLATAVGMVGGVATGTLVVRHLIARLGPLATIRFFWISMLVSSPILLAFPFIGAAWQAFGLFGALMLSGTAVGCMVPTILQDMAPQAMRARLFAVWGMASGLIGGTAPTLVGWTSDALGAAPHMLLMAMSLVAVPSWLGAILLFRMAERPFAELIHRIAERERVTS